MSRRKRMMADLDRDIREHIERETQDNTERGMPPEEARSAAVRKFGNVTRVKEDTRDVWTIVWLEQLWQDLRFGARMLSKSPGTALAAIVLLALGMGGVMTLFGPLYSLVLSPLPFPHSDRLVRMGGNLPVFDDYYDVFLHRRELDPLFSAVAAYGTTEVAFSGDGTPEELDAGAVTPEFFAAIGVPPRPGRDFSGSATDADVVVLSDRFWRDQMRADAKAVGRSILLQGRAFVVTGVMAPGFDFPSGAQIWVPTRAVESHTDLQCVGRMRAGLSLNRAAAGLKTVDDRPEPPGANGYASFDGPVLQPLHTFLLGDRRPLLWILSAVSLLFLCLACAGVANLLLARGVGRRPEMVVRMVLGAGRGRLLRQLLTEAFLLGAVGGLLGLGLSIFAARALRILLPAAASATSVSPFVVPLVIVLAFVAAILCGLAPAFHATGADLNASLKSGNSGITASSPRRSFFDSHELLAGVQLLLAMVLLISTGLLLRSLVAHLRVPLGFQPKNVAVVETDLPELPAMTAATQNYSAQHGLKPGSMVSGAVAFSMRLALKPVQDNEDARDELFYRNAVDQLSHLPGAIGAAIFTAPPFQEGSEKNGSIFFKFDRHRSPSAGCFTRHAGPGAFGVLGIHLLAGRDFLPNDAVEFRDRWGANLAGPNSAAARIIPGVVINETLAERFWPKQNAIGEQFFWGGAFRLRVIGVVSDIREIAGRLDAQPTVYWPFEFWPGKSAFVVKLRPGTSLTAFSASARHAFTTIEPDLPPPAITSLQKSATASLASLRLALVLLGCFSLLGLVVGALGVYATAAIMSLARTREIGIRIALGASAEGIRRLALWRSARVLFTAIPMGALASWALARSLSHWLFQVGAADPPTFAGVAILLAAVALLACWIPARRAMRVDPMTALRHE